MKDKLEQEKIRMKSNDKRRRNSKARRKDRYRKNEW
jgi:hypothetical protein